MDSLVKYIVCDLDGTLCDSKHRAKLLLEKKYDEFNSLCHEDLPIENVCSVVRSLKWSDPEYVKIIIVTAREQKVRSRTERWLQLNNVPFDEIYMRENGDQDADYLIKQKIFYEHLKNKNIWFALEDRESCVTMWRRLGVTCFALEDMFSSVKN